jgi:hypothetical protein
VDKDDTSRRLLTPEDRRDLLFRKVLLFHPENLPFLVMTRFKNLTSRMDQETGRTSETSVLDGDKASDTVAGFAAPNDSSRGSTLFSSRI